MLAADRPLREDEIEVIQFLAAALPDGRMIEQQLRKARVIGQASCCATVSLDTLGTDEAIEEDPPEEPGNEETVTYIEAASAANPQIVVRLVVASDGSMTSLELVHPRDAPGPQEFPAAAQLAPPRARYLTRSEATGRAYSERMYFPAEWYDDVMKRLAETMPSFASLHFNFTDDTPTASCWIELNRKFSDPEVDLDSILSGAIESVRQIHDR